MRTTCGKNTARAHPYSCFLSHEIQPQYSDVGLNDPRNLIHINESIEKALVLNTWFSPEQKSSPSEHLAPCILILRRTLGFSVALCPPGWEAFTHPEGALYFYNVERVSTIPYRQSHHSTFCRESSQTPICTGTKTPMSSRDARTASSRWQRRRE